MSTVERGLVNKFNRGVVSETVFAREDVVRINNSCELMTNFLPKRLGPMVYRPGSEFLDTVNTAARMMPFVFGIDDVVLMVWDNDGIRFMQNGVFLAVEGTPSIPNGTFSNLTSWTVNDDAGASSIASAFSLKQTGTANGIAQVYTTLTCTANVWNYYKFDVWEGPITVKIGAAGGEGRYFTDRLESGEHWIGFNPANNTGPVMTIENDQEFETRLISIVAQTGTEIILDPSGLNSYATAVDTTKFPSYSWDQSADKFYMAVPKQRPLQITRFNARSFGINNFQNKFGPYDPINLTSITLDAAADSGTSNIVASREGPFEYGTYPDGRLIRYAATGQTSTVTATANDDTTANIFVFGTGDARRLGVFIESTGNYTEIVLEKSFDQVAWQEVKSYTTPPNESETYNDGLDGAEIYYRLRVEAIGAATSIILTLSYSYGVIEGQWKGGFNTIEGFGTTVGGSWYVNAGSAEPTLDWYLGSWRWTESATFGAEDKGSWPSAVTFFEGRLWWGGFNKFWGSESDFYESYDRGIEGDSAAIERTIGFGPVEQISWMAGTDYLFAGIPSAELNIRSNNRAVPLSPNNTNIKQASSYGSANIRPAVFDNTVLFVQRSGDKLLSMGFDGEKSVMEDLNLFTPDILIDGVRRVEVARNPETRIYVLTEAGDIWVALIEPNEDVLAWSKYETRSGDTYEDICILPTNGEDEIYVIVSRGSAEYLERFATLRESVGGNISKHYDSFTTYTSPGTTITIPNLANGDTVAVWVDGVYDGTYVIASGQITSVTSGTNVVVGLPYVADYKSNKLTGHSDIGVINSRKRIINTGLVMRNYHYVAGGLQIGPDFTNLGNMPLLENGKAPASGSYDFFPFPFSGISETDPRICIRATQPTEIIALAYDVKNTTDRTPKRGNN